MRPPAAHRVRSNRRGRNLTISAGVVVVVASAWLAASSVLRSTAHPPARAASSPPAATGPGTPSDAAGAPSASGPPLSGSASVGAGQPFPFGLLIADRANDRLLAIDNIGHVLWTFPHGNALPRGQGFSADDAFIDQNLKTIVANDEFHEVVDRIDIATGRIVWQYGHYGRAGSAAGYLHTPDDAYPLPNGNIVVADIDNCRILEIAPDKTIVRHWGLAQHCADGPPGALARPNGDTPLPDGGLLITEITGSRVVRLTASGKVVFDIHVPVAYPSDAQLDANGNVVVADFMTHGQVVAVNPQTGATVWRYGPASGPGRLNHPSLATPLADGTVSVNDDFRQRIVVFDPGTGKVLWQYGQTDIASRAAAHLNTPDGHEPLPPGIAWPTA
jgi:outer membrane protein assembly factor BamB